MISILHPSRSRPAKARQTALEWKRHAITEIEYILSLDTDDDRLKDYETLFTDTRIIINNNRSLVDATNNAAKECKGDIIIVVSDDMEPFPRWDRVILEAVRDKENYLLKTYDQTQSWIVTFPVMDRKFYESLGYIYFKDYKHMFCDTDLTHIADVTGRLLIRNDIVFVHNNPSYKMDAAGTDALHLRNNATWQQGSRVYISRIRKGFDLGIDAMNLSDNVHPGHWVYLSRNGIRKKSVQPHRGIRQTQTIRRAGR